GQSQRLADAQAGPVQQQQNRPKGVRLDQGAVVLGWLDRIQQPADLAPGVDIRDERWRGLREGLRQRGLGEMPATDRETEESLERAMPAKPPARDRAATVEECGHGPGPDVGDGRLWPGRPAERAKNALDGLALLTERLAKGDVVGDEFIDVHSKPSRSKSPTARRPA